MKEKNASHELSDDRRRDGRMLGTPKIFRSIDHTANDHGLISAGMSMVYVIDQATSTVVS
jgi:hypothetical protein